MTMEDKIKQLEKEVAQLRRQLELSHRWALTWKASAKLFRELSVSLIYDEGEELLGGVKVNGHQK